MKNRLFSLLAALSMFAVLILPASAQMSLSARGSSMANRGQTATVEITFTCAFEGSYYVNGSLQQSSGRLPANGYSKTSGGCLAGDTVTASLVVNSQASAFKAGPAQLNASVDLQGGFKEICDEWSCYEQPTLFDRGQLNTVVRLKK